MKISNGTPNYINQTYAKQAAQPAQKEKNAQTTAEVKSDSINLSSTTRDLQKISVASRTSPEDRAEKVQTLKAQVEANQYTVNAEQVAEKILGSAVDAMG